MTLPLALGVNLWVVAVALPLGLAARAGALGATGLVGLALLSLAPLVALALGAGRRDAQPFAWYVAFPALLAVPQALATADVTARVVPAAAFALAAASLVAYQLAVATALGRDQRLRDGATVPSRRLHQDPLPSRWRRRLRVYRGLTAIAVLFPSVLLAAVDLSPSFAAALEASFGAHAARAQALATVGVGLLWIILLRAYVLQPLYGHLQHDRELLAAMEADRRHARRGRPRAGFYFAVTVALVAMVAVVWQRSR